MAPVMSGKGTDAVRGEELILVEEPGEDFLELIPGGDGEKMASALPGHFAE